MDIFLKTAHFQISDEVVALSGRSYELQERIGAGGNGAVYECIDTSGSVFAIKFLLHSSTKSKQRFKQELLLMKSLSHPHIVKYVDDGVVEATDKNQNTVELPFVIMERADGNLIDYLKHHEQVPYEIYAPQFRGLCEALAEIHHVAVHRDIKPENILVRGETWVIGDFGLCSFLDPEKHCDLTNPNEKIGPAFWMSPEAIDCCYFGNGLIDTYSDVFQLCAVFAFVLTRRFPGGIIGEETDLNTTQEIRQVILSSLSNDYRLRPKNGKELVCRYNDATYLRE